MDVSTEAQPDPSDAPPGDLGEESGKRTPIIAYLRVCPCDAGSGIEPQRAAIADFADARDFEIIAEFVEVGADELADRFDLRPVLARALYQARSANCAIAVAELHRLGRDQAFLAELAQAAVKFVVTGQQSGARPLPLSACAAVSLPYRERPERQQRQRAADGSLLSVARQLRSARAKARKDEFVGRIYSIIEPLATGGASDARIATFLNRRGVQTIRGGSWSGRQVREVLLRVQQIEQQRLTPNP